MHILFQLWAAACMHVWRRVYRPCSESPVTYEVDLLPRYSGNRCQSSTHDLHHRADEARTLCGTGRAPAQQERLARGSLSRTPCAAHHLQVLRALNDANALPPRQPLPSRL